MGKTASKGGGKAAVKVGIKEPAPYESTAPKDPPGKPPKSIRMLISMAGKKSYPEGSVYRVPQDIPVSWARSWINSGVAEEVE